MPVQPEGGWIEPMILGDTTDPKETTTAWVEVCGLAPSARHAVEWAKREFNNAEGVFQPLGRKVWMAPLRYTPEGDVWLYPQEAHESDTWVELPEPIPHALMFREVVLRTFGEGVEDDTEAEVAEQGVASAV